MYTEQELTLIRQQIKKRWLLMLIPVVLMLVLIVTGIIIRSEFLADAATLLLGISLIFGYDMTIKPLRCYERLIDGLLHGRTHTLDCEFGSMDEDVSLVEGVNYWGVTVVCYDEKNRPYDRLFYYDVQKPRLNIAAGTKVHLVFHDRMLGEIVPC